MSQLNIGDRVRVTVEGTVDAYFENVLCVRSDDGDILLRPHALRSAVSVEVLEATE